MPFLNCLQEEEETQQSSSLVEHEELSPEPQFQKVNITCPDGLTVTFEPENYVTGVSSEQKQLLIRQVYPYKTMGKHRYM